MTFFTDETTEKIADRHLNKVGKLSEEESKRLLARYREIRRELRDRLDILPSGSFTAQQVRGALVQIDSAITELSNSLLDGLKNLIEGVSEESVEHLTEEISRFEEEFTGAVVPIDVDAANVALEASNLLVNRYESSLAAYSEDIRSIIQRTVSDAAIAQISTGEVVKKIGQFMIGEEWKLQRIARTEISNIYNTSKIFGMRSVRDESMPDLKKTLWHPMDERTGLDSKELDRIHPIVDIDDNFEFTWKGHKRVFFAPPDRPNDRAVLIPFRSAWQN